jgi:hypothetical protein
MKRRFLPAVLAALAAALRIARARAEIPAEAGHARRAVRARRQPRRRRAHAGAGDGPDPRPVGDRGQPRGGRRRHRRVVRGACAARWLHAAREHAERARRAAADDEDDLRARQLRPHRPRGHHAAGDRGARPRPVQGHRRRALGRAQQAGPGHGRPCGPRHHQPHRAAAARAGRQAEPEHRAVQGLGAGAHGPPGRADRPRGGPAHELRRAHPVGHAARGRRDVEGPRSRIAERAHAARGRPEGFRRDHRDRPARARRHAARRDQRAQRRAAQGAGRRERSSAA